jgi:hypothetical protein
VLPTLVHVASVVTVMKKIINSNYSYNKMYDEHTVDMLLPLNAIVKFLITFIDIKMVHYKMLPTLRQITAKIQ